MRVIYQALRASYQVHEKVSTQIKQKRQALKLKIVKTKVVAFDCQQPDGFKVISCSFHSEVFPFLFFFSLHSYSLSFVVSSLMLMNFQFWCSQMCRSRIVDSAVVLLHLRLKLYNEKTTASYVS